MANNITLTGKYRKEAYKMLHRVCQCLDKHSIPYILEAGTLLGIVRENRLLPWDNDIDITITNASAKALLKMRWKIWLMGYRTRVRYFKSNIGPFKKNQPRLLKIQKTKWLFFKAYSLMDIFIKYDIDNTYQWLIAPEQPVLKKCPKHFYDEVAYIEFNGSIFRVPKDYNDYLDYHYGEDWRIPVKEWDYRLDDACEKEELS